MCNIKSVCPHIKIHIFYTRIIYKEIIYLFLVYKLYVFYIYFCISFTGARFTIDYKGITT